MYTEKNTKKRAKIIEVFERQAIIKDLEDLANTLRTSEDGIECNYEDEDI